MKNFRPNRKQQHKIPEDTGNITKINITVQNDKMKCLLINHPVKIVAQLILFLFDAQNLASALKGKCQKAENLNFLIAVSWVTWIKIF